MQKREIRLLFEKDHVVSATVVADKQSDGWNVLVLLREPNNPPVKLSAKRGGPRVFKTADAALNWCDDMGFKAVKVQFNSYDTEDVTRVVNSQEDILLVEDNEDDIALTLRALEKHDIANKIIVKRDGQAALDYLLGNAEQDGLSSGALPGLILLDLHLPKLSGFEVLHAIRSHAATRLIPVVILTTSTEGSDISRGYDLGTNSYLRKPVEFESFVDMVGNIGQYWLRLNVPPPVEMPQL